MLQSLPSGNIPTIIYAPGGLQNIQEKSINDNYILHKNRNGRYTANTDEHKKTHSLKSLLHEYPHTELRMIQGTSRGS